MIDSSAFFTPPQNDIAQAWINYLFFGQALPDAYPSMSATFPEGFALQSALIDVLAFYSDAILVIAAILMFYNLAAMIVETAHHGVAMGKHASQIWAPIRLVIAIGLLVPVNGGLNCGQYIVIKMAEMGSGLASNAWSSFLNGMASYNPAPIPPNAPIVTQIAYDLIQTEACNYDYNTRVGVLTAIAPPLSAAAINPAGNPIAYTTPEGIAGTKYSFSSNELATKDVCGYYFIPKPPAGADATTLAAYQVEKNALINAIPDFATAGQEIVSLMPPDATGLSAPPSTLAYDTQAEAAISNYQQAVVQGLNAIADDTQSQTQQAVDAVQPYGWVLAGAFLPAVERIQGMISKNITAGLPETQPPLIRSFGNETDVVQDVAADMANYKLYLSQSWGQTLNDQTQCAAMIGLKNTAQTLSIASTVNQLFRLVDWLASWNHVWNDGTGAACARDTPAEGLNTFRVGIDLSKHDVLGQMVALGHNNLDLGFGLLGIAMFGKLAPALTSVIGAAVGTGTGGMIGGIVGAVAASATQQIIAAGAGILDFLAVIFIACGFVLAFVLPMYPFTRFFFAVLTWVGAIIEAVIAVPLIALAHLNPEAEGIAGTAKGAYAAIFNLFLRPILSVFGLVAGLLVFMIAASFMTYAYNLAVAASGGTAYGHEVMSKVIYSVLYVAMLYICATNAFSLIDHIPEHALRWMGSSGQAMPRVGDAKHMATYETAVGAYAGEKLASTLSGTSGRLGQNIAAASQRRQNRNQGSLKNIIADKDASAGTEKPTGKNSDIDKPV